MLSLYLTMVETPEQREKIIYIYEHYYSYMAYTAGVILRNDPNSIEDTVHNAMIRIIDNIDLIDMSDQTKVHALCGVIARNIAIDFCRRKPLNHLSLDDDIINYVSDYHSPIDEILSSELYDTIVDIIKGLNEKYRDICILKYLCDYKEREIANLLVIPLNTVGTRLFRGKQQIIARLNAVGIKKQNENT